MSVDIYHSRRTKYERCPFYIEAPNRDLDKWVLSNKPDGIIYCQPVDMRTLGKNPINNVMMFDKDSVVLLTSDHCDNLKPKSVILYRGHTWTVDNISQEIHLKQSEFSSDIHYDTYIYIRR